MNSIKDLTATSQVVLLVLDFSTNLRHVLFEYRNRMVEAVGSRIPFDGLLYFVWEIVDPERELSEWNVELVCDWSMAGAMRVYYFAELLAMLPGVDASSIKFTVCAKERSKGRPILWGNIGFIMVWACVRADYWPVMADGRLKILKVGEERPLELPNGGTLNGGVTPERKADKKAETKKPDLYIVPKPVNGEEKKAKYPPVPKEVWEWCKSHYGLGEWRRILRGLHKFCKYRKRSDDKYYPGTSERKNRQYVYGQVWLAKKMGVNRKTVVKWLKRFETDGIIYIPYRGYKDPKKKVKRGASICELAYTDGHRKKNKRETRERKKALERKKNKRETRERKKPLSTR
jgi:hypothetical protein